MGDSPIFAKIQATNSVALRQYKVYQQTYCRLSKYHSQKPEFTRRTIFNRDSTLQLIVQISSGNVNSSVRARSKTHGRTPVLIELPRGRHLGSDACISLAQTSASFGLECPHLHCKRVHNKGHQMPTSSCARAQLKICAPKRCPRLPPLARVQEDARVATLYTRGKIRASTSKACIQRC